MMKQSNLSGFFRTTALTAVGIAASMSVSSNAYAVDTFEVPTGANVVAGSATVNTDTSKFLGIVYDRDMTVNQSTNRAVIEWNTFNIGTGASVTFVQPSTSSLTVNRVVGKNQDPSTILGTLRAVVNKSTSNEKGNLIIIDSNGVIFGRNATIDVNSIIASTGNITNEDIMDGDSKFSITGITNKEIENKANISVGSSGVVAFVSPFITNSGTITAKTVAFGAGSKVALDLYGDQLINIAANDTVADALIDNSGKIKASTVTMTAAVAESVVDTVINMSGEINADKVSTVNGKIVLSTTSGDVNINGDMVATNGDISITADDVTMKYGTDITAKNLDITADGNVDLGELLLGLHLGTFMDIDVDTADITATGTINLGYDVDIEGAKEINLSANTIKAGLEVNLSADKIAIETDNLDINTDGAIFGLIDATQIAADTVSIDRKTAGDISLGTATGGLNLSNAELATITADDLTIGGDNTTNLSVAGSVSFSTIADGITLDANGLVNVAAGSTVATTGKDLTVNAGTATLASAITAKNVKVNATTANLSGKVTATQDITVNANTANVSAKASAKNITVNAATANLSADLAATGILTGTSSTVNVLNNNAQIQDAIDIASSGATVNVAAGTYTETLDVYKKVSLLGANTNVSASDGSTRGAETIVIAKNTTDDAVVTISADSATVNGFTLQGAQNGVSIENVANVSIANNIINNTYSSAVSADGVSSLSVVNNSLTSDGKGVEINNITNTGASVVYNAITSKDNAIEINNSNNSGFTLVGNTIDTDADGILLTNGVANNSLTVAVNKINALGNGINLDSDISGNVGVYNNTISSGADAIKIASLSNSGSATVAANVITSATGDAIEIGSLTGTSGLNVTSNTIGSDTNKTGNGIVIGASDTTSSLSVTGNRVYTSGKGVDFTGNISNATVLVAGNTLVSDTSGVDFEGTVSNNSTNVISNTITSSKGDGVELAKAVTNSTLNIQGNQILSVADDAFTIGALKNVLANIQGNIVTYAKDFGLIFNGGISGTSDLNIDGNNFAWTGNDGIALASTISGTSALEIMSNFIGSSTKSIGSSSQAVGIDIDGVSTTGLIDITGNTIFAKYNGIEFDQNITNANMKVTGNTINAGQYGIAFYKDGSTSSSTISNSDITLDSNTINSVKEGIRMFASLTNGSDLEADYNTVTSTTNNAIALVGASINASTLDISYNTLNAVAGNGVYVSADSNYGSTINETQNIDHNTITALNGIMYDGDISNTYVTADNNTINVTNDGIVYNGDLLDSAWTDSNYNNIIAANNGIAFYGAITTGSWPIVEGNNINATNNGVYISDMEDAEFDIQSNNITATNGAAIALAGDIDASEIDVRYNTLNGYNAVNLSGTSDGSNLYIYENTMLSSSDTVKATGSFTDTLIDIFDNYQISSLMYGNAISVVNATNDNSSTLKVSDNVTISAIDGAAVNSEGMGKVSVYNNDISGVFGVIVDGATKKLSIRENSIDALVSGVSITNSSNAKIADNVFSGLMYGLILGAGTGDVIVSGNEFSNLITGLYAEDGEIDFYEDGNVFSNNAFDMSFSGSNVSIVDNYLGKQEFNNTATYYIQLTNGAFAGQTINGYFSSYDGVTPYTLTTALEEDQAKRIIETMLYDYDDDATLGQIFAGSDLDSYYEDSMNGYRSITPSNSRFNVSLSAMPYTSAAQMLSSIAPAAGGNGNTASGLNNIEPAAGSTRAACWGSIAGSNDNVSLDYNGSTEDMINDAASCSASI